MKRSICLLMALSLLTMCLFGCTSSGSGEASSVAASSVASVESHEPVAYDVNLATLAGPTGMGMAFMLDSEDTINRYHYTVASAPDQVTAKLINGDYDIAALPTNVAATLYNASEGKIKLLGLNTLGVLYVLEKGDTIRSISDLKGKKVYVSGQGSTPDFLLKYLLTANGIDPENDLTLDFTYSTHADLVAFAASGQADVVLLPEPTVTALLSQNSEMRVALNLNDVWKDAVAGTDHEDLFHGAGSSLTACAVDSKLKALYSSRFSSAAKPNRAACSSRGFSSSGAASYLWRRSRRNNPRRVSSPQCSHRSRQRVVRSCSSR